MLRPRALAGPGTNSYGVLLASATTRSRAPLKVAPSAHPVTPDTGWQSVVSQNVYTLHPAGNVPTVVSQCTTDSGEWALKAVELPVQIRQNEAVVWMTAQRVVRAWYSLTKLVI